MEQVPEREHGPHAHVTVTRGLDELIDLESGVLPFDFAIGQLEYLVDTEPNESGASKMTAAEAEELFIGMGLSAAQVRELAAAAQRDFKARKSTLNRTRTLTMLYAQEQRQLDDLISFGAVTGQLERCAQWVVSYTRDHGLRTSVRTEFPVRLRGPVGRFIAHSAEYEVELPDIGGALGCFNLSDETIDISVGNESFDLGRLTPQNQHTAIHEMVHATSPVRVTMKLNESGHAETSLSRTGFASGTLRSLRRKLNTSLIALNEGTTEELAGRIADAMTLRTETTPAYTGYVRDVATLRELLGFAGEQSDGFYRLYLDERGIRKLAELMRERTPFGRYGLALFDLLSTLGEGGQFTKFIGCMKTYEETGDASAAGFPIDIFRVERRNERSALVPKYPPVTAAYLEKEFPFVRIQR